MGNGTERTNRDRNKPADIDHRYGPIVPGAAEAWITRHVDSKCWRTELAASWQTDFIVEERDIRRDEKW
jgi:hypothetical protein